MRAPRTCRKRLVGVALRLIHSVMEERCREGYWWLRVHVSRRGHSANRDGRTLIGGRSQAYAKYFSLARLGVFASGVWGRPRAFAACPSPLIGLLLFFRPSSTCSNQRQPDLSQPVKASLGSRIECACSIDRHSLASIA
jgi:hypothetical protein